MAHTLEQIAAFVTAFETGSFSAASKKLGKSQSAISVLINNLEIDLGCELFDRTSRLPKPTHEAQFLYKNALSILRLSNMFSDRVLSLQAGVEDRLTIAYDQAIVSDTNLVKVLLDFEEQFPYTEILLLQTTLGEAISLVESGDAEIGILPNQNPDPVYKNYRWVGEFEYVTVTGINHPLAELDDVTLDDLSKYRRLRISNREVKFRTNLKEVTSQGWYIDNHATMKLLLTEGLGWGEMPLPLVKKDIANGKLKELRTTYDMAERFHWMAELLWTEKKPLGRAALWLIDRFSESDWLSH